MSKTDNSISFMNERKSDGRGARFSEKDELLYYDTKV